MTADKIYANMGNMESPVGVSEAAKAIGVSVDSLRRWEKQGRITSERTIGGHRRYDIKKLRDEMATIKAR